MSCNRILIILVLSLLVVSSTLAQQTKQQRERRTYPPEMDGANVEIYKTVGDVPLRMYIFNPADHQPTDRRAAIVFFFGGGWNNGSPQQFEHQCRYLASRGMVAMTADYRVRSRHQVKVPQCIADAKAAVRWVRANANRLGIDAQRIVASGGSAGGHLAAATGLIPGLDADDKTSDVSCVPNAMVLFNPAVALAPFDGAPALDPQRTASLQERLGGDPQAVSPAHHVRENAPPTIIFFGTDDRLLTGAQFMQRQMKAKGCRCELLTWEGLPHGFFNWQRFDNKPFVETMKATDEFLASLGFLEGKPTIEAYRP